MARAMWFASPIQVMTSKTGANSVTEFVDGIARGPRRKINTEILGYIRCLFENNMEREEQHPY